MSVKHIRVVEIWTKAFTIFLLTKLYKQKTPTQSKIRLCFSKNLHYKSNIDKDGQFIAFKRRLVISFHRAFFRSWFLMLYMREFSVGGTTEYRNETTRTREGEETEWGFK